MLSLSLVQVQTGGQEVRDAETLHSRVNCAVLQSPVLFCCPICCIVMQRRGMCGYRQTAHTFTRIYIQRDAIKFHRESYRCNKVVYAVRTGKPKQISSPSPSDDVFESEAVSLCKNH